MTAITTRQPAIEIIYDAKGKRAAKEFSGEEISAARKLYNAKLKDGKNPQVRGTDAAAVTAPAKPKKEAEPAATDDATTLDAAVAAAAETHPSPATLRVSFGVSKTARTRPYFAGQIVARHGYDAGVTAGMVEELDAAFGKPNLTESNICLRNAFAVLRGAAEVLGFDLSTFKPLA